MGTSLISNDSASCPYEIGDGFWTKNTTPPSERWPGTTWEQLKDTFLLSSGDTYSIGQTGGEATHTLTINEMPYHRHETVMVDGNTNYHLISQSGESAPIRHGQSIGYTDDKDYHGFYIKTGYTGNNQSHNNMPPYTVRSYWERTG